MAFVGFDYLNILISDLTVGVKILPEVSACDRLVNVTFNQQLIRFGHAAVPTRVPCQETEGYVPMRLPIPVDILCVQSDNLCAGYTCKLCRHAVTTESDRSNRGRPAQDRNLARCDCGVEVKDSVVSGRLTIFHP